MVICGDGCPNPDDEFDTSPDANTDAHSLDLNMTTLLQKEKRDIGVMSRLTSPDVTFLSTPAGQSPGTLYRYDASSGEDVNVYIVQHEAFDLTISVSRKVTTRPKSANYLRQDLGISNY